MRINVYSQELTDEVVRVEKVSDTGIIYAGAQLILHSSEKLHHPPQDDDRSAVTLWLPSSQERRKSVADALRRMADIFDNEPAGTSVKAETAVMSVGTSLLDEIVRVTAKRERWLGYAKHAGPTANLGLPITLMTAAIREAKAAIFGDNPIRALRALESLKAYDDDD